MTTARGSLTILIGAAPGVGKTYSMLREGWRLKAAGQDVVVAYLESHDRPATERQGRGLETVARRTTVYRGLNLSDMDANAVIARHPAVALVDELAHTNMPGSAHDKRWRDVRDILDSGIDVITTINVQHIESLNDVVRQITGSVQKETVPDTFLRSADQIELIDLSPQNLRERLSQGLVYAPDRINAALSNYFRVGNLTALREIALLWLAGNVDEALTRYRDEKDIHDKWEARERIVVALSGGPEGEVLLRRGARVAAHSGGGELLAVHVTNSDALRFGHVGELIRQRSLVEQLGGSYHQVVGEDIVESLVEFAKAVNATQIVIGVSSRGGLRRYFGRPSVSRYLVSRSEDIDIHIVPHDYSAKPFALPRIREILPLRRKLLGVLFAVLTLLPLTWILLQSQNQFSLPRDILANQLIVMIAALIGGIVPAVIAALISGTVLDLLFITPVGSFAIYQNFGLISLVLYVAIAVLVGWIVGRAERRSLHARRASAESEFLSSIADNVLRGRDPLQTIVDRTAEAFGFSRVAIRQEHGVWIESRNTLTATEGQNDDASEKVEYTLSDGKATLITEGKDIEAHEQRLFNTILTQTETVLAYNKLRRKARELEPLEAANKVRTALLNALSHDLRRPLASATAAVSGLRGGHEVLTEDENDELLGVAADGLSELTKLVTDLLDVSRLREDAMPVSLVATDLEWVIGSVLDELDIGPSGVKLTIDEVPLVCADPPLLRRAIANLLLNAQRFNPSGSQIGISVSLFRHTEEIRVIDYGPGIPDSQKAAVFIPFQRLDDTDNTTGLGLGLALSKGFVESMGGTIRVEDTPGGGSTMVIALRTTDPNMTVGESVAFPRPEVSDPLLDVGSLILPTVSGAATRITTMQDAREQDSQQQDLWRHEDGLDGAPAVGHMDDADAADVEDAGAGREERHRGGDRRL